ncbi:hypothetical protein, partial [Helicobacter pylori]|uniref:hypothetical protein n=1 Tax=Helicobacter pylori TaxID=210 RepID=UPI0029299340
NHEMIDEQIHKLEQLNELYHKLQIQASSFKSDLTKYTSNLTTLQSNLDVAKQTLSDLEIALKNEENTEVVSLRSKIEN